MPALTQTEAEQRALLLVVQAYAIDLALTAGGSTFEVATVIDFECRQPGAETFLQLESDQILSASLNGRPLDPSAAADGRLTLSELWSRNRFECQAVMAFSGDGPGLVRRVDAVDGSVYVYADCEVAGAPRIFPCFDQPDLKAAVTMYVTAPAGWTVLGNGSARPVSDGRWELATTPPLATYVVTVCAGPFASRHVVHDGITLAVHARASLTDQLDRWSAELFDLTSKLFDQFHRVFGIRYPFGEYHQVFAPEYVSGAMENPGCVVLRDDYLYPGDPTVDEVVYRAVVIAHEMAHMWFGNLVTLRWWDDLWLNESFAEYAGLDAVDRLMPGLPWTQFALLFKAFGYAAERRPTAHPVAGSRVDDTDSALVGFDSITYGKGTAALRQLALLVGEDAFIHGLRGYLTRFSFGNAALGDLLDAVERASGQDLRGWEQAWLRQEGRDQLTLDVTDHDDGTILSARLRRIAPAHRPGGLPREAHRVEVAGWSDGVEAWRTSAVLVADEVELPDLIGRPRPRVMVPNAGDLTWAASALDPRTLEALPGQLSAIPDQDTRAAVWVSLIDGMREADVDPHVLLDLCESDWVAEPSPILLDGVLTSLERLLPDFLVFDERELATGRVAGAAWRLLDVERSRPTPDRGRAIPAVRAFTRATDDEELLRRWMSRQDVPFGLGDDSTVHWLVIQNLARRGALTAREVQAAATTDGTYQGRLGALRAGASIPTTEAKRTAWDQFADLDSAMTLRERVELVAGLWTTPDLDLIRPYVDPFVTAVPPLGRRFQNEGLTLLLQQGFIRVADETAVARAGALLGEPTLEPLTRRNVQNLVYDLSVALTSRRRYAATSH